MTVRTPRAKAFPWRLQPRTDGSTPRPLLCSRSINFGNAGRNTVLGPRGFYWDFSTHKDFRIKEGHELQFRCEAFNVLNHPVWGLPNTSLSSTNFGRITSTNGSMRQMQFALKYVF